ncbi:DUF3048 domain-containing protein [Patescibacteria group bacterium]|nr:DUF3048 domain-containing protein [Patescibacteria group bacterium]
MNKQLIIRIALSLVLFFGSGFGSYLLFSPSNASSPDGSSALAPIEEAAEGATMFDQTLPKTEECPLNGVKYSKQQKEWWEKHRPLGIMIENHENSRPQSGLSFADVIYEVVAEGGITRFLPVYYCNDAGQVGPVRSARTYFLDFISEYGSNPLYAHVGGANTPGPANALGQIGDYGWGNYNDLNQFAIGFPVFWRDYQRLGHPTQTEHTMYSKTRMLWEYAAKNRKLTQVDEDKNTWDKKFVSYGFKEDASSKGSIASIHLEFWSSMPDYFVDWKYDIKTNSYLRKSGGQNHMDRNTNKQIIAKNIVVLSMIESNANDGYDQGTHLLYRTKGTGKATIFMDGKKITGTWKKSSREGRTIITDNSGKEIQFNRGLIWFEVLPTTGVIQAS